MEIEELLDDYGTAWRAAQPDAPIPDHTRLRRRRPPAPLLAAGVALSILAAVIVVLTVPHGDHTVDHGSSIPSISIGPGPLDLPPPFDMGALGSPGLGLPRCRDGISVSLQLKPTSPVTGTLRIHTTQDKQCHVQQPQIELLDSAGTPLDITMTQRKQAAISPEDVQQYAQQFGYASAGHDAVADMVWDGYWCGHAPTTVHVRGVIFPGNATPPVAGPVTGNPPPCNAGPPGQIDPISKILVLPVGGPDGSPPAVPGGWAALHVAVAAHPQAETGDRTVIAEVTLSNPTNTAITLRPCPTYRAVVFTKQQGGGGDGVLNCRAGPSSLGPHTAVVFRIRLTQLPPMTGGTLRVTLTGMPQPKDASVPR